MSASNAPHPDDLHGTALLEAISLQHSHLPRRTVFAMAFGGLRVRMTRSVVTLTSVVLAIAFLCYTGLFNELVFNLAQATQVTPGSGADLDVVRQMKRDATEIDQRLRQSGFNTREVLDEGNPQDKWLIVMALLTCAVGIANAMLMSVTERFREIGTMKCLGALDSLVVKLFLIESGLLGVVGASIGILLGLLVALLAGVLQFERYGLALFPWSAGAWIILYSVLAGLVLAVSGAVYPALVAARMNPVDALRVDE